MIASDVTVRFTPSWLAEASGGQLVRRGLAPVVRSLVTDSRRVAPGDCFVALHGGRFDGHEFVAAALAAGASGVIVDRAPRPGTVPRGRFVIKVADTGAALLALAAAHRRRFTDLRLVALTGSCGKTSTKDMLGRVLGGSLPTVQSPLSYNNAVGVPLTLFQLEAGTRAAVVEVGTSGPGEVARLAAVVQPQIAIITCIAESHLEGLGSLEGVAREKAALLAALPPTGLAIVNADDPATDRWLVGATPARKIRVSVGSEADWFATDVRFCGLGTSFLLQGTRPVTIPLLGSHNVTNALFTIAAATELGVPLEAVLAVLADVQAVDRRLQCRIAGGVQVFDDTYNMNPLSARAALLALSGLPGSGRRVVVFGEMAELGARSEELHRELGAEVAARGIDLLLTVGDGARPIAGGARAAGMGSQSVRCVRDLGTAHDLLLAALRPGDRLLCKASRRVGLDRLVNGLLPALEEAAQRGRSPAIAMAMEARG